MTVGVSVWRLIELVGVVERVGLVQSARELGVVTKRTEIDYHTPSNPNFFIPIRKHARFIQGVIWLGLRIFLSWTWSFIEG